MERSPRPLLAIVLFAAALAACGSSTKSALPATTRGSSTTPGASVSTTTSGSVIGASITIGTGASGFMFSTSPPAKAGSKVTVKNTTAAQHTLSADTTAGGFDVTIDAGKTVTFTAPSKPGTYGFHCNIHNYMKGSLTVT